MSDDGSRLAQLRGMKLAALVRDHGHDVEGAVPAPFALGAALRTRDGRGWVLAETQSARCLGPALAWSIRANCDALSIVVPTASGVVERRARRFAFPVDVWHVEDRRLLPAVPEPLLAESSVSAAHEAFVATISAAGAAVTREHGVLAGEVRGLEVCRVVDDPHTGQVRLEVGVGAHDREAFALLHGDRPTAEALADVVAAVAVQRADDAPMHPLNRLAPERLLRARVVEHPELIGASAVRPISPPVARTNVKDSVPCAAVAMVGGAQVALGVSAGVDLDIVPFVVDVGIATGLTSLMVAAPARDLLAIQHEIAALVRPAVRLAAL
jgi:hypothetical protein